MKKYTLRYAITAIAVLLAVVAVIFGVLAGMYYYRLHHYPNVAYHNEEGNLIYEGREYYRVGATISNSVDGDITLLGEITPNSFYTRWYYTSGVFSHDGTDKTKILVVNGVRTYFIYSTDPNISEEELSNFGTVIRTN